MKNQDKESWSGNGEEIEKKAAKIPEMREFDGHIASLDKMV